MIELVLRRLCRVEERASGKVFRTERLFDPLAITTCAIFLLQYEHVTQSKILHAHMLTLAGYLTQYTVDVPRKSKESPR